MLRVEAAPEEIRELGRTLERLARDDELAFELLFDPLAARTRVGLASDEVEATLRSFGLVEGQGGLVGAHRIRRRGARFYVMEIGQAGGEYRQDVWPETDALLDALDVAGGAAGRRVLDLGTGSGIVAIEAAALGHDVVATDLYDSALALARFNAVLNGLEARVELRRGHLFEPVAGERFDLVLTAPHYTRVCDQLRHEVLRAVDAHLAPGGRAVVATFLEWPAEGEAATGATVRALLEPLAARGTGVRARPLVAAVKRDWFTVARTGEERIPGLVSRQRFVVEVEAGGRGVSVTAPDGATTVTQAYVPLALLRVGPAPAAARAGEARGEGADAGGRSVEASGDQGEARGGPAAASGRGAGARGGQALAVVRTADDVVRLEELLRALAGGAVTLDGAVLRGLLDACRFGARACVSPRDTSGAAGAILDAGGGVRPCAHGTPLGRVDDSMADLLARQRAAADAARRTRGCDTCAADPVCSHCLFPGPLAGAAYCDFVRAHATTLPRLHRLFDVLRATTAGQELVGPVRIEMAPAVDAAAARPTGEAHGSTGGGAPTVSAASPNAPLVGRATAPDAAAVSQVVERARQREAWLVTTSAGAGLSFRRRGSLHDAALGEEEAAVAELLLRGGDDRALVAMAAERLLPLPLVRRTVRRLSELLG